MTFSKARQNILITGGTGLIGSYVARALLRENCHPILLDASPSVENVADIASRVTIERGDITNINGLASLIEREKVDRVIHLAAVLMIEAGRAPEKAIGVNCIGTSNIFELGQSLGLQRIVYASSTSVYGSRKKYQNLLGRAQVDESDPVFPSSLYAGTKYLCEQLAGNAIQNGLDVVALRPVLTYGPGRFTGGAGIINSAIRDACTTGSGIVTAPWAPDAHINTMFVKDCASMLARACLHEKRFLRPVYNMGTGEYSTMAEMMAAAERSMENKGKIGFALPNGGGAEEYDFPDADSSAIRAELGWTAEYTFESASRECVESYQARS